MYNTYNVFLCFCNFPIQWPESGVVHDCADPDLWLLSCFVLFKVKSDLVRDELMLVRGPMDENKGVRLKS